MTLYKSGRQAPNRVKLYGKKWRNYRLMFLKENPQCVLCGADAKVVDHIVRHNGDESLFWNTANHQPMCKRCHDSVKQRYENTGRMVGCDEEGLPVDPNHPWA